MCQAYFNIIAFPKIFLLPGNYCQFRKKGYEYLNNSFVNLAIMIDFLFSSTYDLSYSGFNGGKNIVIAYQHSVK